MIQIDVGVKAGRKFGQPGMFAPVAGTKWALVKPWNCDFENLESWGFEGIYVEFHAQGCK